MVGLIIALCLLPVRRIVGQSTVVSILSSKAVPSQQLEAAPECTTFKTPELPPKLSTNIHMTSHDREGKLNRPSLSTTERPPLFVSHATPDRMAAQPCNNSQNVTNDADKMVFKEDDEENQVKFTSPPPRHTTDGPIIPAATASLNTTQVELDERSSFDGDQCPTGYVRVNGKCVEKD
ncbi:uncharacterized protein LOC114354820 [Ostrinia furnacalis]|uniref:uncharacterized protein LOC114354820 n=1 Tax=Ostrinia furnacalis TaxID=93504 RepID=UPI00103AC440|nr:uncharacterized protein LOC114354820 [Ostrinia furnacalis]XP_028163191.1 uncharacterized protein LOC114354820 [Ostrinia furnacalis]